MRIETQVSNLKEKCSPSKWKNGGLRETSPDSTVYKLDYDNMCMLLRACNRWSALRAQKPAEKAK